MNVFNAIKPAAHAPNTQLLHFIEMIQESEKRISDQTFLPKLRPDLVIMTMQHEQNELQQTKRAIQMNFDLCQLE
jgi:hypothetical protein